MNADGLDMNGLLVFMPCLIMNHHLHESWPQSS